jgi:glycosyltransferase involved in cell wall biosynthesis
MCPSSSGKALPLVTIGVCVRNCAPTIREAIDSVIAQDYPHELLEIIFVEDGSNDNTLSIIKEYIPKIDMKVKIFSHKWRGLGYSRNVVVTNANGDFILWVDGDMVISKNFVSKLVNFMMQHPEVGVAKGKQALHSGGNMLATLETFSRAAGRMVDYQSEKAQFKSLGAGGAIYRIEAIKQAGGFDQNLKGYCEDLDMEIKLKKKGWLLATTDTYFLDYERLKLTWKNLWSRYWLRGYHTHCYLHKNRGFIKHYRMFPPAAFLLGILHAHKLFKMTHKKEIFLLPLQYVFKMTAWYVGFIRSHINSYKPTF